MIDLTRARYIVNHCRGFLLTREEQEENRAHVNAMADALEDAANALKAADEYIYLLEELVAEHGAPLPFDELTRLHEAWLMALPSHKCGVAAYRALKAGAKCS